MNVISPVTINPVPCQHCLPSLAATATSAKFFCCFSTCDPCNLICCEHLLDCLNSLPLHLQKFHLRHHHWHSSRENGQICDCTSNNHSKVVLLVGHCLLLVHFQWKCHPSHSLKTHALSPPKHFNKNGVSPPKFFTKSDTSPRKVLIENDLFRLNHFTENDVLLQRQVNEEGNFRQSPKTMKQLNWNPSLQPVWCGFNLNQTNTCLSFVLSLNDLCHRGRPNILMPKYTI